MSDEQRRALVTGAGRGIGRAVALALAEDGYAIGVHYHADRTSAQAVVKAIRGANGQAELLQFDVADRQGTGAALEADLAANGAYHAVVLNAGLTRDAVFPALSGEQWDGVIDANLTGFYNVLQPLIMPMIRRRAGGRVVAMSSVAGVAGNRGQTAYAASKAGLIGAAKSLGLELASRGITVNCVAPGFIDTDMTAHLSAEEARGRIPAGRSGTPEEVAALVRFLVSDAAAYVTRQVIQVDGGLY